MILHARLHGGSSRRFTAIVPAELNTGWDAA